MKQARIRLEKYQEHDFASYYELVKEDAVMRYISGKGHSLETARRKFDTFLEINAEIPELGYFNVLANNGDTIGECKLVPYPPDESLLEIGYILKESHWRQGYGSLICTELLALADKLYPNKAVIGLIHPENTASKRLLEKFGFQSFFIGKENSVPTEKLLLQKDRNLN